MQCQAIKGNAVLCSEDEWLAERPNDDDDGDDGGDGYAVMRYSLFMHSLTYFKRSYTKVHNLMQIFAKRKIKPAATILSSKL